MLDFLKKYFRKEAKEEKKIFKYDKKSYDPLPIYLRMKQHPNGAKVLLDFELIFTDLAQFPNENPGDEVKWEEQQINAYQRIAEVCRHAFQLEEYKDGAAQHSDKEIGLIDACALLFAFCDFIYELKKKPLPSQNPSPNSASSLNQTTLQQSAS